MGLNGVLPTCRFLLVCCGRCRNSDLRGCCSSKARELTCWVPTVCQALLYMFYRHYSKQMKSVCDIPFKLMERNSIPVIRRSFPPDPQEGCAKVPGLSTVAKVNHRKISVDRKLQPTLGLSLGMVILFYFLRDHMFGAQLSWMTTSRSFLILHPGTNVYGEGKTHSSSSASLHLCWKLPDSAWPPSFSKPQKLPANHHCLFTYLLKENILGERRTWTF